MAHRCIKDAKAFNVHTLDATPVSQAIYTATAAESNIQITAHAMANGETSHNGNDYIRTQSYKTVGGVLSEIGTTQNDYTKEEDGGWNFDLAHTGNDATAVITGDAAEHVDWTIWCDLYIDTH